MTHADNTPKVLGRSHERAPGSLAQPPAYSPTIHTPAPLVVPPEELPYGWRAFQSRKRPEDDSRHINADGRKTPLPLYWYATSPLPVDRVKSRAKESNSTIVRKTALKLDRTVCAESWDGLKAAVREQCEFYDFLMQSWQEG